MTFKDTVIKLINESTVNALLEYYGGSWQLLESKVHGVKLLSTSTKVAKGADYGTANAVLYLSPASETAKQSLCPYSNKACRAACLVNSGQMVFTNAVRARALRTIKMLALPEHFHAQLTDEITRHVARANKKGVKPVVRLNGTSDIHFDAYYSAFPELQFVEYTKRHDSKTHANVSLTFSYSGTNLAQTNRVLENGGNVAVVFIEGLPATWNGYRVIDGDKNDNRFLDPSNVIVGLTLKGTKAARQAAITSGFAV